MNRFIKIEFLDGKKYDVSRLSSTKTLELQDLQEEISTGITDKIDKLEGSEFKKDDKGNVISENEDFNAEEVKAQVKALRIEQIEKTCDLCLVGLEAKHSDLDRQFMLDYADMDIYAEVMVWMFGGRPGHKHFRENII